MADPTLRALRLLELLQSATLCSVADLADRLGVDERTVRRDVRRLTSAGVCVESVRGRYGGYRLAPGSQVLPIVFSGEEAAAVFLALAGADPVAEEAGTAVRTARSKVRRAMRPADAGRGDAVLRAVARGTPHGRTDPEPAVMLTLAEAVESRRAVEVRYRDRHGDPSRRTIHPHELVTRSGRWYVVATDPAAGEERTFRADRVVTARALLETFAAPERDDAAAWLVEHFAAADYRWTVVLHVHATEDHVRAHLPPTVARLEPLVPTAPEGGAPWHRVEIHADRLDWIPAVIASLGCEVRIESPDELRDLVRAAATRMMGAAQGHRA
ncbi:WYL domain-containing protein [Cellulomonas sp. ES6]|uniref:helix-turn-helix transcriptional regulator n=1 Tax=Cellulomonas sp. ES6 TaxID=3039384 RepID=UPI0024B7E85A|nr:WYL domain-containing protein [Cellulomonas sp. ES6]WHP17335.1 WYL domain-containing protein [Cellulomonas sp. ES6]